MKQTRSYIIYFYLITPIILLVTFAIFFNRFQAAEKAVEDQKAAVAQQQIQEKAQAQADLEKKLDAEAKRVAAAKAEAAAIKEAKERAERREKIDTLSKQIESTKGELKRLSDSNATKEQKVKEARAKRIQAEADWLEQAKAMERERALKAATDLEAQRLIGMVIDRFNEDWAKQLTTPPTPPAR